MTILKFLELLGIGLALVVVIAVVMTALFWGMMGVAMKIADWRERRIRAKYFGPNAAWRKR